MSNFDIVSKLFHEHIEYLSLSADAIADVCDTSAAHIANAIVSEKKVFSIGVGLDSSTALSFCQLIRDGVWLERPSLPIIELTAARAEPTAAGSILGNAGVKQLRAAWRRRCCLGVATDA